MTQTLRPHLRFFLSFFFLDLHGDATPPAKATRVTHSGELITAHVPPLAAFEDDTHFVCVCVRVCRQKKNQKSWRVLLRKVSAWGKPDAERQRCLFSRGSPSHLAVKSPPSSKRGETRGGKQHSLRVEFGSWTGLIGRRDLGSDVGQTSASETNGRCKESPESQSRPKVQFCL